MDVTQIGVLRLSFVHYTHETEVQQLMTALTPVSELAASLDGFGQVNVGSGSDQSVLVIFSFVFCSAAF